MTLGLSLWLLAGGLFPLAGCRRSSPIAIAVIPRTSGTIMWEPEHGGAQAAAFRLGARIYWNAPTREDDVEGQIALVERVSGQDYQGIVLAPDQARALMTPVKRAMQRRVSMVVIGSPLPMPASDRLAYILNDDQLGGQMSGPPWYSAPHLFAMAIVFLLLALLVNLLYHRVDRWRLRAIVEEREHLAFEMHDTLAQGFAGIGFQLEAIRTGVPEEFGHLHQQIELARELVRHSHAEARRTVDMLRPRQLESEGLLSALALCARRLVAGGSVGVISRSIGEVQPIPLRTADQLYRIGQEALANAVRHAHPSTLNIILEYTRKSVCLLISDDGSGFKQQEGLGGFGLPGMQRRALNISARLEIASQAGRGTRLSVTAPLPPRMTFRSWPPYLSKFIREHLRDATTTDRPNPYPYRG